MKHALILIAAALVFLLVSRSSHAQTAPIAAPAVFACTNPVPPIWPGTNCKAASFQPLTNLVPTVSSGPASKPVWAHTFSGYGPADLLLTCPAGAALSADLKQCTGADGRDASKLVAKSAIPTFSIAPATPANPTPGPVSLSWSAPTAGTKGEPLIGTLNYLLLHRLQPSTAYDAPVHVGATMSAIYTVSVPGVHCWAVEAFLVTSPATIGDPSGELCQLFDPSPPAVVVPGAPGKPTLTLVLGSGS